MTTVTKFEPNATYVMLFIGDADLKVKYTCIKRTDKTVTFQKVNSSEVLTRKIKNYDNVEYVVTENYSMAPSIYANKKI